MILSAYTVVLADLGLQALPRKACIMDLIIEVLALVSFLSLIVSWLVLPASTPLEGAAPREVPAA